MQYQAELQENGKPIPGLQRHLIDVSLTDDLYVEWLGPLTWMIPPREWCLTCGKMRRSDSDPRGQLSKCPLCKSEYATQTVTPSAVGIYSADGTVLIGRMLLLHKVSVTSGCSLTINAERICILSDT